MKKERKQKTICSRMCNEVSVSFIFFFIYITFAIFFCQILLAEIKKGGKNDEQMIYEMRKRFFFYLQMHILERIKWYLNQTLIFVNLYH